MSTEISGVDPGAAVGQSTPVEVVSPVQVPAGAYAMPPEQAPPGAYAAPPGVPVPGGYTPGAYPLSAYPTVAAPAKPPFWRRPVGIVLMAVGAVGLGMVLLFGVMIFLAARSAQPLDPIMLDDFATAGDRPMVVEGDLAWDQSNGTLNIYPQNTEMQYLDFHLPDSSDQMRVQATLIEPAAADPARMLWGVAAFDSDSYQGVALLCTPGGTMFLADVATGEPLPVAQSDFPCGETMTMSLQVDGRYILYGPDPSNANLYSGDAVYGSLDTASVVIAAEEPDQVLRVTRIAAYQ